MKKLDANIALKHRARRSQKALNLVGQGEPSMGPGPDGLRVSAKNLGFRGSTIKRGWAAGSDENWTLGAGESTGFTAACRDKNKGNPTPLSEQHALLKEAIKESQRVIDNAYRGTRSEAADFQGQAIAALYQCVTATLRLSEFLGEAAGPSAATCRYLGTRIHWGGSINEQAYEFLETARHFVLALTSCVQPASSRSIWPSNGAQSSRDSFHACLAELSPTQRRAFDLLLKGRPNKLIAYELGVAESTVKTHMSSLFRKLRVRSRAHAIAIAADLERDKGFASEFESRGRDASLVPGTFGPAKKAPRCKARP